MKQAILTAEQWDGLQRNGYTFTERSYYWRSQDGSIVHRITREEFCRRSIAEPLQGVEQVRVYRRNKNEKC